MTTPPANNQNNPSGNNSNQPAAAPTQTPATPPPGVDPQAWAKYQQDLAVYNQQMAAYKRQMAQQASAKGSMPPPPPGMAAPVSASSSPKVAQPVPVPTGAPQPTPVVKRPRSRRRPRFVEKPKKKDDSLVARRNLLATSKPPDGKHQFSRERKIAGNLPDWDPTPPGEIRITRHAR